MKLKDNPNLVSKEFEIKIVAYFTDKEKDEEHEIRIKNIDTIIETRANLLKEEIALHCEGATIKGEDDYE